MPVVHVRGSLQPEAAEVGALVAQLPAEVEAAAGLRSGGVWCTYTPLGAQSVAGEVVREGQLGVAYVDILLRTRSDEVVQAVLQATAEAVSRHLGVPLDDVWASVRRLDSGQVFAGGSVLSR